MADTHWDVVIVGQGLAGTTLAWQLTEAGQKVLILDSAAPVTSSKIAAGLITPITGQRLVLSRGYNDFFSTARAFYARIEARTGAAFFRDRVAVRLFSSQNEQETWAKRKQRDEYRNHLVQPQPATLIDVELAESSFGGFAMHAAQLDVTTYLEASRHVLTNETNALDWNTDVKVDACEVMVGDHRTKILISCEGFAATENPWFQWVPFIAAKGDILTVRFEQPLPPMTIHRGIWIAPTDDANIFRVGSTYDWKNLNSVPSQAAREEIEAKLVEFVHTPYKVLDHQAAVRPIISESRPQIGLHPEYKRLGFFNGLGSKGSLLAPWYANCLTDHLVGGIPIPEPHDVARYF